MKILLRALVDAILIGAIILGPVGLALAIAFVLRASVPVTSFMIAAAMFAMIWLDERISLWERANDLIDRAFAFRAVRYSRNGKGV